ncbi:MAG TPA: hypothetical protein VF808_09575 [Ktedonobacterales bacterium]
MAQFSVYPIPSCAECGIQSAGSCPTCHHPLCMDHFAFEAHEPCASRLAASEIARACYICGAPASPQQWSSEAYAHYVDPHTCRGCHRAICDEAHTTLRDEDIIVRRDGMRSHRYHMMKRYCPVCARLRFMGGLIGAGWWLTGVVAVMAIIVLLAQVALG